MNENPFDVFVALDGPVLNGFEGPAGVLRLRYFPNHSYEVKVKFFDGAAGGHAVQINKEGTIGYLGGLARCGIFFDTKTLEVIKRFSTTNYGSITVPYESQTHVVFLTERTFITSIRGRFYKVNIDDTDNGEDLGPHNCALPHAVKLSPSGRYLFYGVMDHDLKGYVRQFGIFDLQEPDPQKRARVIGLDDTAWHFAMHPKEDIIYAVSECYDPQPGIGVPYDFNNFVISYRKNYAWKIDGRTGKELAKVVIPAFLPSHLTSDVVVMADENDTIYYNSCASSTITGVQFKTSKVWHIDEKVTFWYVLFHPGVWRAALENLLEAATRAHLFGSTHVLLKALRTSRGSLVDGSYGLQLSPDGKLMFSAHRGLNQIWVYDFPSFKLRKKIKLPPARKFFKPYLGIFADYRLGMHHAYLSKASANR
ncbi:MAG: hypothetical protein IT289_07190 [Oligoflexia bacterium]|nr:hypothetical protein [Oligoflexia bacterium]